MNKKQQEILTSYNKSRNYSLNDVYKSYSVYKGRAQAVILAEMENCNGWGFKILGANSCAFSCAYLKQDENDGTIKIVYHTAQNKKVFDYIA